MKESDVFKRLYPENYNDHMKNMSELSEERIKNLPSDTLYLDTSLPMNVIEHEIKAFLNEKCLSF